VFPAITDAYADREDLIYYDGPVIGTASCLGCGQLFLYRRFDLEDSSRVWLYFPIESSTEEDLIRGAVDPAQLSERLQMEPHLRIVEVPFRVAPCRAEWVRPRSDSDAGNSVATQSEDTDV